MCAQIVSVLRACEDKGMLNQTKVYLIQHPVSNSSQVDKPENILVAGTTSIYAANTFVTQTVELTEYFFATKPLNC